MNNTIYSCASKIESKEVIYSANTSIIQDGNGGKCWFHFNNIIFVRYLKAATYNYISTSYPPITVLELQLVDQEVQILTIIAIENY